MDMSHDLKTEGMNRTAHHATSTTATPPPLFVPPDPHLLMQSAPTALLNDSNDIALPRKVAPYQIELSFSSKTPKSVLKGHTGGIRELCFSSNGRYLFSWGLDRRIGVWNVPEGNLITWMDGYGCLSASPRGDFLASGGQYNALVIWNAVTFTRECCKEYHDEPVRIACFDAAGEILASGDEGGGIVLTRACSDWSVLRVIKCDYRCGIMALAFVSSHTTLHLISGMTDKSLKSIDVTSGKIIASFEGHDDCVSAVVCSPVLGIFSASFDGSIIHWNMNGHAVKRWNGKHRGAPITTLSLFASFLGSGGQDATVRIWAIPDFTLMHVVRHNVQNRWVTCVAFHCNGGLLASAGRDKVIKLWSLE